MKMSVEEKIIVVVLGFYTTVPYHITRTRMKELILRTK